MTNRIHSWCQCIQVGMCTHIRSVFWSRILRSDNCLDYTRLQRGQMSDQYINSDYAPLTNCHEIINLYTHTRARMRMRHARTHTRTHAHARKHTLCYNRTSQFVFMYLYCIISPPCALVFDWLIGQHDVCAVRTRRFSQFVYLLN